MEKPLVSICVTCKNRSKVDIEDFSLNLFPNFVDSILNILPKLNCNLELIVSDWESVDWPLKDWLPQKIQNKITFKIVSIKKEGFSRGFGLNRCFEKAGGDILFFTDVDMLISEPQIIEKGISYINKKKVFFPICFSYSNKEHNEGYWRPTGFGNVIISRKDFEFAGKWWEKFSWGAEDLDLRAKFNADQIIRENVSGFFHQWHENNLDWKNKHGLEGIIDEEKKRDNANRKKMKAQNKKSEDSKQITKNENSTNQEKK